MKRQPAFTILVFLLAFGIPQAYAVEFSSEQSSEASPDENTLKRVSEIATKYKNVMFWFEPNPSALTKLKFLETIPTGKPGVRDVEFRPNGATTFKLTNIIPIKRQWSESFDYYMEITFAEGKVGYLKMTTFGHMPSNFNIYEGRPPYSFEEYVYLRDPEAIRAEAKQKEVDAEKAEAAKAKALAARGGVRLGMTKSQVLNSNWGTPDEINRTIGKWGVHEQWVYGDQYLYFENGKLTTIQD